MYSQLEKNDQRYYVTLQVCVPLCGAYFTCLDPTTMYAHAFLSDSESCIHFLNSKTIRRRVVPTDAG
jgi:hypothetical protein